MNHIYVNIAGFNIKVFLHDLETIEPRTKHATERMEIDLLLYLRKFIIFEKIKRVDFEIIFTDDREIEIVRLKNEKENKGYNSTGYTSLFKIVSGRKIKVSPYISIFQFEIVLKQAISMLLGKAGGFGIHASAAAVRNKAYLFLAPSGGGKSTIAELLQNDHEILADDIILTRKIGSKYFAFQTPFFEKTWRIKKSSSSYEIDKVFFLKKSKEFEIVDVKDQQEAETLIMNQILNSTTTPNKRMIEEMNSFTKRFRKCYTLFFAKDSKLTVKLINSIK